MAKHNKKRNTMFIYETLLREVVKQSINKDMTKRNVAIGILKEHFKKDTELRRELDLYRALLETRGLSEKLAEKLITETLKQHSRVNQEKLFTEQSTVIGVINKKISKGVFANFVPNYKDLATIAQIFADSTKPKSKIMLENKLIQKLAETPIQAAKAGGVSGLVVKSFVKRFNDEYVDLLKEQKELLSQYIGSFVDTGAEFNFYLNEEIGRLKIAIAEGFTMKEIKVDKGLEKKLESVRDILDNFNQTPLNQDGLAAVLKVQSLVEELQR